MEAEGLPDVVLFEYNRVTLGGFGNARLAPERIQ